MTIRQEINAYRNLGHEIPGIIGCAWDKKGGRFLHHHLPSINSHEPKESIDLNIQLQQYFEFVANVWFSFAPGDHKEKFPRNFKFPVTVPYSFLGVLPAELRGVPRFEVSLESYDGATVSQVPQVSPSRPGISQLFGLLSIVRRSRREWVKIAQDEILGKQPIKTLAAGGPVIQ